MNVRKNVLLLGMVPLLLLTGCTGPFFPTSRDITNVQLMRTMALDKGEEPGNIKVTVSGGVRPGSEGGGPQPPVILSWEAPTVFAACLTIQTYGNGYVSFGHVGQVLLSGPLAEEGVTPVLDFVERDFEMRMDTALYVTEDSAADLLSETASEHSAATDRLESVRRDLALESKGWEVSLRDFLIDIEDNGCGMAPALRLEEEKEEQNMICDRMGWFQDGRWGGELDEAQSRAAAILTNHGESGAVEVKLSDSTTAGVRLTSERCQWVPVWNGGVLTGLTAQVKVRADLAELQGNADLYNSSIRQELEQKVSETLERELNSLLRLTQEQNADLLHLSRTLQTQEPWNYRRIQREWDEWFPTLELTAQVETTIERSYDVNRGEEAA